MPQRPVAGYYSHTRRTTQNIFFVASFLRRLGWKSEELQKALMAQPFKSQRASELLSGISLLLN